MHTPEHGQPGCSLQRLASYMKAGAPFLTMHACICKRAIERLVSKHDTGWQVSVMECIAASVAIALERKTATPHAQNNHRLEGVGARTSSAISASSSLHLTA